MSADNEKPDFGKDHVELRDMIRRVVKERVAMRAAEIDRSGEYPQDMFDLLKELGLFTLPFPVEYGGANSQMAACIAVEEFCRVCYNTAYLLVVQWAPFGAILTCGSDDQKKRYLPGLAAGDLRGAISTTEPQSGSDVAGIKMRARKVDGGYRLTGQKIWCTNSMLADFIVIAARTGESRDSIHMFIIDKGTKGLEVGPKENKLGARGVPSSPLYLDDAFVPVANRMGEEGQGFKLIAKMFDGLRPVIGARGVGLAQGALELAIEFVQNRVTWGRTVSEYQGIRWMIADMGMQTEAARQLVYKAASMIDAGASGPEIALAAAYAKAFATDVAMKVATDAVQLFGATGISNDAPINRYMRDAKVLQIVEGTNQIQRNIIGNLLLGRAKAG